MDANQLYMLGCRFPKEVIPIGLRADVPRVSYDDNIGWVGEYWYFASGSAVPRMYVKLHLPDGLVLEARKLTDEIEFTHAAPTKDLDQKCSEYLAQCASVMNEPDATEKERNRLVYQWMETHTENEKMWFQLRQLNSPPAVDHGTAPPKWLVEYWTAERVCSVLLSESRYQTEYLLPTDKGRKLWHLGKEFAAAGTCIPPELEPGLPRFSHSDQYGWMAEYWYYYANAGLGLWLFAQPKYYMKVCLSSGQLLEARNLTGELQFRKSWLDVWAVWTYQKELDYLACCESLLEKMSPTAGELAQLEGMWLEAHPKEHAIWLANCSHISESAIRWILSPDRIPNLDTLKPLWFGEMVKGVRMGTPEVAEMCVKNLSEFGRQEIGQRRL